MTTPFFFRSTSVAVDGTSFLVMYNGEQRYRIYDSGGALVKAVAADFVSSPVDEHVARVVRDSVLAEVPPELEDEVRLLLDMTPIPEALPTAGTWQPDVGPSTFLYVDDQRRVWVQEYQKPNGTVAPWRVHTAEGDPLGRVVFPQEVTAVLDSRGDTVLALWSDAVGMEQLTVYSIHQ